MWFDLRRCDPDQVGPRTLSHEITLAAEPGRVFDVLCDEEAWPRWFPDMVRSRWLTAEPHGVGSLRRADMRPIAPGIPGLSVIEHFVCFRPGERMTFYVERMSLPLVSHMVEDYQLEPVAGGTRLRWQVHYRVHRPMLPLHPVAGPIFDGMFATGIRNLAAYVATEEAA